MIALNPIPRPLDHLALRGAAEAPALQVGDRLFDYRALDETVGRTASRLLAAGAAPGDRVASWMGKTWLACVLPLAAARAGLVHVPINPLLKSAQAAHILSDSGASLLIGNRARLSTLDEKSPSLTMMALEDWIDGEEALPPSSANPDALVALLYTSGSTGRPKGVMLSHANLWLGAISVAHYLDLGADDRTLCVLPLAFDYGQSQLLSTWAAGGCAIGFDYLLPNDVKKAMRRHDVTVLAGVPPLWHQLASLDWSDGAGKSLRTLTNSGGHLPEALVRRLRALFPAARLHLMYGLTEAFRSASLDPALVDHHPDSVGKAIPFAELSVIRSDGQPAGPGEEGELIHAGPLVAKGYWKDEPRTAARFQADGVHSGDRVRIGDDGLLRVLGRDDAMLKVSGNRLSPQEIEELALASGAVREAAAFGLKDEEAGQVVGLVAVPEGDAAEARLKAWFAQQAPAYMMPRQILWIDKLPTGPTGKLDRVSMEGLLA